MLCRPSASVHARRRYRHYILIELSANATTPIPTLRNAFFVGDVLSKRDVTRLQHLAAKTTVINMYGTTETERAV